jgi:Ca2+-transporting ATPase
LLPAQILWINMLTHGLPGVAFGGEPLDPAVMKRPSMSPQKSVMGEGLGVQILGTGVAISIVSLAAGLLAQANSGHPQTWIFLTLGLAQLGVAMALRAPRGDSGWRGRGLELSVLLAALLQVGGVVLPPLQELLGTHSVSPHWFLVLLGMSLVPGLLIWVRRRIRSRS